MYNRRCKVTERVANKKNLKRILHIKIKNMEEFKMSMFCFQCQETAGCKGCTVRGVCGKTEDVAKIQDLLIFVTKGLATVANEGRKVGIIDKK